MQIGDVYKLGLFRTKNNSKDSDTFLWMLLKYVKYSKTTH